VILQSPELVIIQGITGNEGWSTETSETCFIPCRRYASFRKKVISYVREKDEKRKKKKRKKRKKKKRKKRKRNETNACGFWNKN
jgi:hypothetical protein